MTISVSLSRVRKLLAAESLCALGEVYPVKPTWENVRDLVQEIDEQRKQLKRQAKDLAMASEQITIRDTKISLLEAGGKDETA